MAFEISDYALARFRHYAIIRLQTQSYLSLGKGDELKGL